MLREGRLKEWQRAAKERPAKALAVSCRLATIGRWDGDVWQATLLGIKDGAWHLPMFRRIAALLANAPDIFFAERGDYCDVCWVVASWIHATTGHLPAEREQLFWSLWDRLEPVAFSDVTNESEVSNDEGTRDVAAVHARDAVTAAINDPAGILTQCLLQRLDARKRSVGAGLPKDRVRAQLTKIVDERGAKYRLARVILASSLPAFHAIDPSWTSEHFLRWFDWSANVEDASAVSFGYLTSGMPGSPDLFFALRDWLVACVDHERELGSAFEQCWQLIILAAFEIPNAFASGQVKRLLRRSKSGRENAAFAIWRYMPEDKPNEPPRGAEYWRTRVGPWIAAEWPQDKDMRTSEISEHLALAALQSGALFSQALSVVSTFLVPVTEPSLLLDRVASSSHPEDHPESVLCLLSATMDTSVRPFLVDDLRRILGRIAEANATLHNDRQWKRLNEYVVTSGSP